MSQKCLKKKIIYIYNIFNKYCILFLLLLLTIFTYVLYAKYEANFKWNYVYIKQDNTNKRCMKKFN